MNAPKAPISRETFEKLIAELLQNTGSNENWTIQLEAEDTQFIRFNQTRVRQIGTVVDARLSLSLVLDSPDGRRTTQSSVTLSGDPEEILQELKTEMSRLREEAPLLPIDPYAVLPQPGESSVVEKTGELPSREFAVELLREPLMSPTALDLAGIFASGVVIRGNATTAGQRHWYQANTFSLDYSLYTPAQKALKNLYAGEDWSSPFYKKTIESDRKLLEKLEHPSHEIARGTYRVYLGPQAVHEILSYISDDSLSEAAIRQQESPFRLLRSGEKSLSPLFHLTEDFRIGLAPRFNEDGSIAPEVFPLISEGKLVNTLISARTAAEYHLKPNGADDSECMRSPVIHPGVPGKGGLKTEEILKHLGTGLYLSNLHYLGWSDSFAGRITGMTRYACFWVENGEILAPIRDLRFDESVFEIFGASLEALTEESWLMPSTSTYDVRELGGSRVPGILLSRMNFTL